jgi:hypothetical protein
MDLDWEKLVKRYVWDTTRTPYLTRTAKLNRVQASYELFAYALGSGVLLGVVALASLSTALPHGDSAIVAIYAFSALCAAVLLGLTRHPWAAMYCAGAPVAALGYFAAFGFHPNLGPLDQVALVAAMLAWCAYAWRVVAIARRFPELPETTDSK